jgi:hypothetical protein
VGVSVTSLEAGGHFDAPIQSAAAALGVGVTTLKKVCRAAGMPRWPYRARASGARLAARAARSLACSTAELKAAAGRMAAGAGK